MKIDRVHCFRVAGPATYPAQEERQVGMLDSYPEFAARPPREGTQRLAAIYVQVDTDGGPSGLFGPIFEETALLIKTRLAPYLVGQDPLAGERLWDVLYRQDRHARKGYEMMAISAVDNALWDVRGKHFGLPVYRLLGGPTRERVPCYASMLGSSLEPGLVRERVQQLVEQGFKAQKWFFRYGPADGLEGMERNVALVRTAREAAGPTVELMFDCWMGWDTTYAIRLLDRIAEYRPRWLEEPVPADRIHDLAAIRRSSRVPIASGEHEYTRWGALQLLQAEAVDVLQVDPDWCGGISELVKICTLASAFGKPVIPHGHSVPAAVHVIAATPPGTCPMAEFLVRSQPAAQHFHTQPMQPVGGAIPLPEAPGLGLEIDQARVEEREDL
ncbi:MAG TPA: enolase C-terminal domain-like protein [Chloroflexota bacterium]|jgi:L-rhamnonate dehydratase|nr:enolase C-terminal domain-like protein [Chloroflexota bacterium]